MVSLCYGYIYHACETFLGVSSEKLLSKGFQYEREKPQMFMIRRFPKKDILMRKRLWIYSHWVNPQVMISICSLQHEGIHALHREDMRAAQIDQPLSPDQVTQCAG